MNQLWLNGYGLLTCVGWNNIHACIFKERICYYYLLFIVFMKATFKLILNQGKHQLDV